MLAVLDQWAVSFDLPILDWIQANLKNAFLNVVMPFITMFGDGGIFWIACAVILLYPGCNGTGGRRLSHAGRT